MIEAINRFERITRFDLRSYLRDYSAFMRRDRRLIVDYYSGTSRNPNERAFRTLNELLDRSRRLNGVLDNNREQLFGEDIWDLVENISDIEETLITINNTSKWVRSSITQNDFSPGVEINYTLGANQTLEEVSGRVVGADTPQDDWVTIALRNNLEEGDYTTRGGNVLNLGTRNNETIQIQTLVDNITGERVYGLDIDREIAFEGDDIKSLTPRETIQQTVEILTALKQGDIPEFPGDGIQANIITGANINSIPYPVLIRQMTDTFVKDDTLESFRVNRINTDQDNLSIDIQVETRLGDFINANIQ